MGTPRISRPKAAERPEKELPEVALNNFGGRTQKNFNVAEQAPSEPSEADSKAVLIQPQSREKRSRSPSADEEEDREEQVTVEAPAELQVHSRYSVAKLKK